MKLNGNAVKPGNVIEHKGRLWTAVKVEHVKPGKGGAFAQIELRDIRDGTKLNERFRSSETVERVILEESECSFLYDDGDNLVFMHGETYEQIAVASTMVGDVAAFLQDGMLVTVSSHEGDPISVQLPDKVVMEVVEADAVVKGRPPRQATSLPFSKMVCAFWCRRISRPAPASSCVRKTPAMSSAPRTDSSACPDTN